MSPIRGITPIIQAFPSFSPINNILNKKIIHYLRNSSYNLNNTREQVNIQLDDLSPSILENFNINYLIGLFVGLIIIIMILSIIILIAYLIEQKEISFNNIIPNFNIFKLIKCKNTDILPQYYNKKVEYLPNVSCQLMPLDLSCCSTLDRAEKGQNNLLLRVSIPYRRYTSINNTQNKITEHQITITMGDSNKN